MGTCCERCFGDTSIKAYVGGAGDIGDCDYCRSLCVSVADTAAVGQFIRADVLRAYVNIENSGIPYDPESGGCMSDFVYLDDVFAKTDVFSELVIDAGGNERLFRDLMSDSAPDAADGYIDELDNGLAHLVEIDAWFDLSTGRFGDSWDEFRTIVKHDSGFFEANAGNGSKSSLLGTLSELLARCRREYATGLTLWRGRSDYDMQAAAWSYLPKGITNELGPAPLGRTRNSRTSPEGISYMYLGDSVDTCVAELHSSVGTRVCMGKFVTIRDMVLLDLTSVPKLPAKSIFSPDYDHDMARAQAFMNGFINEIRCPMSDQDTGLEYLPTQALAEWTRHQGYDGIGYLSSQNTRGHNYVLFCGPRDDGHSVNRMRPFREFVRLESVHVHTIEGLSFAKTEAASFTELGEDTDTGFDGNWHIEFLEASRGYFT